MKCPYCSNRNSKVIDSRATSADNSVRRRRECLNCGKRYTTYETVESDLIYVTKKNGGSQPFDSEKIKNGIIKASEKRPVTLEQIENIVLEITKQLQNANVKQVTAAEIGQKILKQLQKIDEVSYIRFASVFYNFNDKNDYLRFIEASK